MSSIFIDKFGGRVPRITNPRKLPKSNAQKAQDVDLTSGDLVPIAVDAPFQSLHETDGTMKAGLTRQNLTYIPKPPVVKESSEIRLPVNVAGNNAESPWMAIRMYVWVTYVDAANNFQEDRLYSSFDSPTFKYTKDGMIAKTELSSTIRFNTVAGIGYTVRGPIFRFELFIDNDYRGGPDAYYNFPETSSWSDPAVQQFTVPLTWPLSMENFNSAAAGRGDGAGLDRYPYGFAELVDYDIPRFEPQIVTENDVTGYEIFNGTASCSFTFRNNYVRDIQQISYYRQAYVDQTVAEGDLNSSLSGGIAQVVLKDPMNFGESDVPQSGRLLLKKVDALSSTGFGATEVIDYHAYSQNPSTDVHEFAVVATLTNAFAEDDVVEVIDPTADGREGPPSDESDVITRDPGVISVLEVDDNDQYPKVRLYRSDGGGDDSTYARLYDDARDFVSSGTPVVSNMDLVEGVKKGDEITHLKATINSDPTSTTPNLGVIRVNPSETQEIRYTSRSVANVGGGLYQTTFRFDKVTVDYDLTTGDDLDVYSTESNTTYDSFTAPLTTELPPYGNVVQSNIDTALEGSILHPAGWGAVIDGNKLFPSDVLRPWVIPEDYEIAFPTDIMAAVVSGNSILVFTEASSSEVGKVFELVGNTPAFLATYELSNAHPLLNKVGLAKIGQTAIWPTYDGLAASAGGSVSTLTEKYFTREEWADELPASMDAYTSENTVWLTTPGAENWRVDLDELQKGELPDITLGTYTAFSGKQLVWDSKIFEYPRPIAFSCLRVIAEAYPVAVEFYNGNGELRHGELVMNDQVKKVKRMRAERNWYIRVYGLNTVYSLGVATNPKELSGDGG